MEPQKENNQSNNIEPEKVTPDTVKDNFAKDRMDEKIAFVPVRHTTQQVGSIRTYADDLKNAMHKDGDTTPPKVEEKIAFTPSSDKVQIRPIRTYADDIKNVIQNDGVSMAKIVMAEAKKQEALKRDEEELSPTSSKNKNIIMISIIAIAIAIAGIAGAWIFVKNKSEDQSLAKNAKAHLDTIIPYDQDFAINLEAKDRKKIVSGIVDAKNNKYEDDTAIVYLPIFLKGGTTTELMKTERLLLDLETRVPAGLRRSLDEKFMLGLHKTFGQAEPFLILYSDSFNQMYAGMLEWEPAIADDIGDLFFSKAELIEEPSVPEETATTTGSTTPQTQTNLDGQASTSTASTTSSNATSSVEAVQESPEEQREFKSRYIIANSLSFKDELQNNRDLRTLRSVSGKLLMYYTFINDGTLLIAKDLKTLDEVVRRLATSQFKQ